jgi:hypothetical protein
MPRRLLDFIVAALTVGLASLLLGPVAATMLTPGWLENADVRDWAGTMFFLCGAAALLFLAWRLARRSSRPAYGYFSARDWKGLAALAVLATIAVAIASHWVIALPGLLPIALAILFARRRARQETAADFQRADPSHPARPGSISTGTA